MLYDAIHTYLDGLNESLAIESKELLEAQQRRRNLSFGDRLLCTVLRPRFLTVEQYRYLRQRIRLLMQAFYVLHERSLTCDKFRKQFRLTAEEEELFLIDPGFKCPMPTARFDAFLTPGGAGGRGESELYFTEFNAETPAAAAYSDELADVFFNLPAMSPFLRRYHATSLPTRQGTLRTLLETYFEWSGSRQLPRIAIVDWSDVPTRSEFLLFQDYFRRHGLECILADPGELEFRQGKLFAGEYHVNLIYKRVLISELLQRCGSDHAILRAYRNRAVCMINPPRCKALYKKASLAALSDELNAPMFNAEQREAILAHVPWTRVVEDRSTTFDARTIDLVPFLLKNKDQLVLKPNDDYGGKGIVLGWMVDEVAWSHAVEVALSSPYVVQHRIHLPEEPFPAWVDGQLQVSNRMLDTAPFIVQGDYVEGCLTRLSSDPLLNVTAGGGSTVPTFVIEPR